MTEDDIKKAETALKKQDPKLAELFKSQKLEELKPRTNYFESLCRSINGQQISVAAANAIYGRFVEITDLDPAKVVKLTDKQVKYIGLSKQKLSYIKDLAQHFLDKPDRYNHLEKQDDETVIEELTEIRGIGEWTAQMFLISSLARIDVFAPDDVGLQRAIVIHYGLKEFPKKDKLLEMSAKWAPYRTVASLHLWHSLNNAPSIYK